MYSLKSKISNHLVNKVSWKNQKRISQTMHIDGEVTKLLLDIKN